ncbi:hypothetical protein DYBT9623_03503 [Dyadobacter sp. CECT 9623]|uniref:Gliding motility-associated C-terminal domain-containing protein n=1 Tax=Dyadobacter linearis TaxID=2823330 RepID=A0ABM8UTC1_9BACT|nr:gliding motility-associated C-terminal domain-containing protein [Dyadobacter sp. CECT 9623]CAG5071504.1 hypothetical protein DYBT9623_03503 [Dyadobacter sp. CECT 9623]
MRFCLLIFLTILVANIRAFAQTSPSSYFTLTPNSACSVSTYFEAMYTGNLLPHKGFTSERDLGNMYVAVSDDFIFEWEWVDGMMVAGSGLGPFKVYWLSTGIKTVILTITNVKLPENKIVIKKTVTIAQAEVSARWEHATCTNDKGKITVVGEGGTAPYLYSIDSVHFQTDSVFVVAPGYHQLAVKEAGGCVSTVKPLRIDPVDEVILNIPDDNVTICAGQGIKLANTSNAISHTWSPAAGLDDPTAKEPFATPSQTTTYTVTGTLDCKTAQRTVTVEVIPGITVHVTGDTRVDPNTPVQLNAFVSEQGLGNISYVWTPEVGLNNAAISDPIASIDQETTYQVTATSPEGCTASTSTTLSLKKASAIFMPGIFSPNGDGKNETFSPQNGGDITFNKFIIYSRSGEVVYFSDKTDCKWDGSYRGQQAGSGDYFYKIEGVTSKGVAVSKEGSVLLIR